METFSHPDTVGRYGEEKSEIFEAKLRHIPIFCHIYSGLYTSGLGTISGINSTSHAMGKCLRRTCHNWRAISKTKGRIFREEGEDYC